MKIKNTWVWFFSVCFQKREEKVTAKISFSSKERYAHTRKPQIVLLYMHYMAEACETPHLPYHRFLILSVLHPQGSPSSITAPLIKGGLIHLQWILPHR